MSSKKWLLLFASSVLLIAFAIAAFNYCTDPFGAFGDRIFQWHAYNFTKNPRVAKIAYLDRHHGAYDSYLIGSSSTSSFPVELLDKYLHASFYNLFMYGADIYDVTRTVNYVVNNYEVKNIVLNLGVLNAEKYMLETNPLTDNLHAKTEGAPLLPFYAKYLFANPRYGLEKLQSRKQDSYLPRVFDVFNVATGAYDKSLRDIERIQDLPAYLERYPVFRNYPYNRYELPYSDELIENVREIKELCDGRNINLLVLFFPLYYEHAALFNYDRLADIYSRLAEITGFWDFSVHPITTDPRFFYDATHFRNDLGRMALAKVFGDETVYVPEDFGVYVTPENARKQAARYRAGYKFDDSAYTKKVPVLLYHHLAAEADGSLTVSAGQFEAQIKALAEAGYTGVSLGQLVDYVEKGTELPDRPVVVTFDDGYASNYEIAYPILQKYGMKATIFVIGASVGKETYKDTAYPIIPHFGYGEAREMLASGLLEIQSHTYDMHQSAEYEGERARTAVVPLAGESEEAFIEALRADFQQSRQTLEKETGTAVFALSYPLGKYSDLTEVVLKELGVKVTLTTEPGVNTLIKGLPQCLQALKRIPVDENTSPEALLKLLQQGR
ncbi:MAG TPA: polysaccharide deacetylase family protein [Firmicutes bacterium]|nr:polysaccharide deacetylase family protein [Bacillota bacterium]